LSHYRPDTAHCGIFPNLAELQLNQHPLGSRTFRIRYGCTRTVANVQTQTPPKISENPTAHALSILLDNLIVPNAKTNYRPEKYKDLDLVEFTRQTVIMKTLWSIYETIPSGDDSPSNRLDRMALKDAIEKMQAILFPWITSQKQDNVGVSSIFALQDSYRSDAGIVITTGKRTFRWTVHQITTLRNVLHCNLPVEM
jgi:hypothetical protein